MSDHVATLESIFTGNIAPLREDTSNAEKLLEAFAAKKYGPVTIDIQTVVNGEKTAPGKIPSSLSKLLATIKEMPAERVTTVRVNAQGAIDEVTKLGRAMRGITDKNVTVTVNTSGDVEKITAVGNAFEAMRVKADAARQSASSAIASRVDQPIRDVVSAERRIVASPWSQTIQDQQNFKARQAEADRAAADLERQSQQAIRNAQQSVREGEALRSQLAANELRAQELIQSAPTRGGVVGDRIANRLLNDYGPEDSDMYARLGQKWTRAGMHNLASGAIMSTVFTAPVVAAGKTSLDAFGDFEKSMNLVGNLTNIGRQNIAGLSKEVLALSQDPNISKGPKELADALFISASHTRGQAEALEVLRQAAYGATAGEGKTVAMVNSLTASLNAYKLSAKDAPHVADIITNMVKQGGGNADQYAAALPKVVSTAAAVGVSLEQVGASIATMTRLGIPANNAAMSLNRLLLNFEKPSAQAKKAAADLHTSFAQMRQELESSGLAKLLQDLIAKSGGDEQKLIPLFGSVNSIKAVLSTALSQGDAYKQVLATFNNIGGLNKGAAAGAMDGFATKMEKMKSAAEALEVEVGSRLAPRLTGFITTATEGFPEVLKLWDAMPGPFKEVVLSLTAMAALSGPLTGVVGLLQVMGGVGLKAANFILPASFMTGLTTFLANPVVVGFLAGTMLVGGAIAWERFRAGLDAAGISAHNIAMAAEDANAALDRIGRTTDGNQGAAKTIDALRKKIQDAGDDIPKLGSAIKSVTDAEHDIKNLHLSPAAEQSVMADYQRLKAQLEAQKIELNVGLQEKGESWWETIKNGFADAATGHGAYARGNVQTPLDWLDGYNYLNRGARWVADEITGGPRQIGASRFRGYLQNNQTTFTVPSTPPQDVSKMNWTDLVKLFANLNKIAQGREFTPGELSQYNAAVKRRDDLVETRRQQLAKNPDNPLPAGPTPAQEEQAARNLRELQQEASKYASEWERAGNAVESAANALGKIGAEKSETAEFAAKAQVASREFADIPESIKLTVIGLGQINDQMRLLTSTRDTLRGLFGDMAKDALRTGQSLDPINRSAQWFEKQLDFRNRMTSLYNRGQSMAKTAIDYSEGQRETWAKEQERLGEAGKKSSGAYTAPNWLSAMEADSGKTFGRNCAEELKARLQAVAPGFGSMAGASMKEAWRVGLTAEGKLPAGTIVRYPPGMAGAGNVGNRYGHYAAIGSDLEHWTESNVRGKDTISKDRAIDWAKLDADIKAGRAFAFTPPGSADATVVAQRAANTPALDRTSKAAREWFGAPAPTYDGALVGISPPAGWKSISQYGLAPGESRQWQLRVQDLVSDRKAFGDMLSAINNPTYGRPSPLRRLSGLEFAQHLLNEGVERDRGDAVAQVTDRAKTSIRDMGREIRLVAAHNNPYLILEEELTNGASRLLSSPAQNSLREMTLGLMVKQTRDATSEMRRQISGQFQARQSVAGLLAGDGTFNSAAYDRASFIANKRAEIYDAEDIRHLREAGKGLEAATQAQMRLNVAVKDFDNQKAMEALKGYAESMYSAAQQASMLTFKTGLLQSGMNPADVDIAGQAEQARRDALQGLQGAVVQPGSSGITSGGIFGLGATMAGGGVLEQLAAGKISSSAASAMAAASGDKANSLALGQRSYGWSADQKTYDFQQPLADALLQQRLQDSRLVPGSDAARAAALAQRIQEQTNQISSSVNARQLDPAVAQKRIDDATNAAIIEDKIGRYQEEQNNVLSSRNSILEQEQQRQEALAKTASERLQIELGYDAQRRALTGRAETEDEKRYRLMLDGEKRVTAAQEDRLEKLKSAGSELTDMYKSLFNGDFKSIGNKLRESVFDLGARQLTALTLGKDSVDDRATGLLGLFGLGRHRRIPTTTGVAGPLDSLAAASNGAGGVRGLASVLADSVIPGFKFPSLTAAKEPPALKMPDAVNRLVSGTFQITTATINVTSGNVSMMAPASVTAPAVAVSGTTVNVAGAGSGGGSFSLLPFLGGRNGAPRTGATPEQQMNNAISGGSTRQV